MYDELARPRAFARPVIKQMRHIRRFIRRRIVVLYDDEYAVCLHWLGGRVRSCGHFLGAAAAFSILYNILYVLYLLQLRLRKHEVRVLLQGWSEGL